MRLSSVWCEYAWLGGETPVASVTVTFQGGRIASVIEDTEPPPGALRLKGLTFPGFANTHSHAFHRTLRGRNHDGEGSFWTWREDMYRVAASLDPDSYHTLAKRVYKEMAGAGYTVVGEFHYLHHDPSGIAYTDPNAMGEALLAAAAEVGIRITLLDTLYLHGGLDGAYQPPNPIQRRFSDGSAGTWAERVSSLHPTGQAKIGAAIHSVRAVDPDSAAEVAAFANGRDLPLHAHVSEQPAENAACIQAHGMSPTELLADAGATGGRFTAVHGTHLTSGDIEALSGSSVCLCPTTERDLADGIGQGRRLAEAGARLCIGSDSQAVIDPFEETRAVELNERLSTLRRGNHRVTDLLGAATANGYISLGWPEGGTIAVGGLADLVTVDLHSPRLDGAGTEHLLAAVLYSAHPTDVTSVIVDAQHIVSS